MMMLIPQDIKQVPSPSFDSRDGYKVDRLIIHTTEGSYASSVSWLARTPTPPDEGSSAHYVVSEDGSQATQLVDLANNAWHCGNQIWNKKSVGIENSGYASKGGFSDGLYRTSAKIAAYVCKKFSIVPVHGQTVFAHNDVPQDPANWHTDPGPLWDWNKYMGYIQEELKALTTPDITDPNSGATSWHCLPTDKWVTDEQGFLTYWRTNGGMNDFGYPISGAAYDSRYKDAKGNALIVQWFERARFEYHPENDNPYKVLLGLVGKELLAKL